MAPSLETRQRVFVASRPFFRGWKPQMRQIKDFVKNHEIMRPLREEIGQSNLLEIVKGLVSDRLFNSNARAMRAFPSLFLPETNAGDKPVYNEIPRRGFSMNHKLTVGNERVFLIDPVGDGEGHATTGSGGSDQTAVDGKQTKKVKDQGNNLPLPELRLPFATQHRILSVIQRILEEVCFDFMTQWLPSILKETGYDCAPAMELTGWVDLIFNYRHELGPEAPALPKRQFSRLIQYSQKLRNVAVHRNLVSVSEFFMLTYFAVELAEALKDDKRAEVLRNMRLETDHAWESIVAKRDSLETKVNEEMEEIQRAREELDRREKEVVCTMLEQDCGNTSTRCRELEESLKQAMQGGELILL